MENENDRKYPTLFGSMNKYECLSALFTAASMAADTASEYGYDKHIEYGEGAASSFLLSQAGEEK